MIYLIKAGADVHAVDNIGRTPSHVAYHLYNNCILGTGEISRIAQLWESALDACGYDTENFRKAFYTELGPWVDSSEYVVPWFDLDKRAEEIRQGRRGGRGHPMVRNIYWTGRRDNAEELKKEDLEEDLKWVRFKDCDDRECCQRLDSILKDLYAESDEIAQRYPWLDFGPLRKHEIYGIAAQIQRGAEEMHGEEKDVWWYPIYGWR